MLEIFWNKHIIQEIEKVNNAKIPFIKSGIKNAKLSNTPIKSSPDPSSISTIPLNSAAIIGIAAKYYDCKIAPSKAAVPASTSAINPSTLEMAPCCIAIAPSRSAMGSIYKIFM